ncbi:hypothetical protein FGB62_139g223 [Gracilaria domingensis]|nr:hypothetical protein FGB62_139g223 [Gracilaria domingensis]
MLSFFAHLPVVTAACPPLRNPALSSRCLPPLANDPQNPDYAHCKNETCYIFIDEDPFIRLPDISTPKAHHFRPFPCGQPHRMHPELTGITFRIHSMTASSTASCIWAGPKSTCSFNQLNDFAATFAMYGYKFVLSGAFLDTQDSRCNFQPSAPQLDSAMMIVGPNILAPARSAFEQLTRPFRTSTWVVISLISFLFAAIGMIIAVIVANKLSHTVYVLMGHRDKLRDYNSRRLASSLAFLRGAVASFGAICYLFYAASVVNFLFAQSNVEMTQSISSLSASDLAQFAVLKDSALERVWDDQVNPTGMKYNSSDPSSFPWRRCLSGKQCVEWVFRGTHGIKFAVTYNVMGNHFIHEFADCNVLTEWTSRQPLPSFNIGWLYNKEVSDDERMSLNREIVGLRINGTVSDVISRTRGDMTCSDQTVHDVGILVVLIPLAVFVLPIGFIGMSLVVWAEYRRHTLEKRRNLMNEAHSASPSVTMDSSMDDSSLGSGLPSSLGSGSPSSLPNPREEVIVELT